MIWMPRISSSIFIMAAECLLNRLLVEYGCMFPSLLLPPALFIPLFPSSNIVSEQYGKHLLMILARKRVGTGVEHHTLYQYQLFNTQNIYMGFAQTETPYYQPSPAAPAPFTVNPTLHDPDFATTCAGQSGNCANAWGLRIVNSNHISVYGAGLYSFFNDYSTSTLYFPFPSSAPCSTYFHPSKHKRRGCCNTVGPKANPEYNKQHVAITPGQRTARTASSR
jgi:hypothetical protein